MKTDEDIARMKSCMNMPLHSSRIAPPRTTSLRRHTSNLSPKSTGSHSPKHTPLHLPRRSTERQPSLRRAPSNTFHLNTESSLRRTQENNGSITPTHSTKPKKHGKKGKKGGKRKNSSENSIAVDGEGTTTADGEWEDEADNISVVGTGGEKHSSFGLAGSFKSLVGSVKSAVFGTSLPLKGSGSGITTVSTTGKKYIVRIFQRKSWEMLEISLRRNTLIRARWVKLLLLLLLVLLSLLLVKTRKGS